MGSWGYAQVPASTNIPSTPVIAPEGAGTGATSRIRCGTGAVTYSVNTPGGNFATTDQIALFDGATVYPPVAPTITGAITQGWGYDFNAAGATNFNAGQTTTGFPAQITGSSNGPTSISARSTNGTGNVGLTATSPIEGATSLVIRNPAATPISGDARFLFSNFGSGNQFYFRTKLVPNASANYATANASQFAIYLGNTADPAFTTASSTLPTTGVFAPIYVNAQNNTSENYYISRTLNANGNVSSVAGFTDFTAVTVVEVYGNTGTARYYYNRDGVVYWVDANKYDIWINNIPYTQGDEIAATNNVTVNAILITSLGVSVNDECRFDDVRFISTIANAQEVTGTTRPTCTAATTCAASISSPSITASTTYKVVSVRPQSAGNYPGIASSTATAETATINAVPVAPTATSPVNICGPSGPSPANSPITFTVSLPTGANAIVFGNSTRTTMDESGTAGTNIGNEAGWTGSLSGATVTASYIGTAAGANNGLEAAESTTLFAYAVNVNPNLANALNTTPVMNAVGSINATRLLYVTDASGNGVVYDGCASTSATIVVNANEIPANVATANLDATAPAFPLIQENAATVYSKLARCGTGTLTYTVDLSTAALTAAGTPTGVTGIVELYDQATGGTALASSASIADLKVTSNTATITTPSVTAGSVMTYYLQYKRTDRTPNCVSSARFPIIAAALAQPTAPTITATLHSTMTCFAAGIPGQAQIVNLSAAQGATPATHYRFYGVDQTTPANADQTLDDATLVTGINPVGIGAFVNTLGGVANPTQVAINTVYPNTVGGTGANTTVSPAIVNFLPSETRTYYVEGVNKLTTPFVSNVSVGCTSATKASWTVTASATPPTAPTVAVNSRCGNGTVTITVTGVPANTTNVFVHNAAVPNYAGNLVGTDAVTPYEVTSGTITATTSFYATYSAPNPLNTALACTSAVSTAAVATITAGPAALTVANISTNPTGAACQQGSSITFKHNGALTASQQIDIYTVATGGAPVVTGTTANFTNTNGGIVYNFGTIVPATSYYFEQIATTAPTCTSARTSTAVTVPQFRPTPPSAVVVQAPCGTGTLTFSGAIATGTTGVEVRLYNVATGGTALATATGANFNSTTGLQLANATSTITTYYLETVNTTGSLCASVERTTVPVTIASLSPAAPTVSNITMCVPSTAFVGTGGNYAFSIVPTINGAITKLELLNSNTTTPAPTILGTQTSTPYTFNLSTSNGAGDFGFTDGVAKTYYLRAIANGCTASLVPVTVTFNKTPSIPNTPVAVSSVFCGSGTVTFTFAATGNFTSGDFIRLYTAPTGGTQVTSYLVLNPVSAMNLGSTTLSMLTTTVSSTTSFYMSQFNTTNSCESDRVSGGTVVVNGALTAPTVTNTTFCGNIAAGTNLTFTLTGLPTGLAFDAVRLYTVSTGGTAITAENNNPPATNDRTNWTASANTLTYKTGAQIVTTTTYFVEYISAGCTSSRVQVVATQQTAPAAPTATDVTICGTLGTSMVTITASGSIPSSGGVRLFANPTGGAATVTDFFTPYELTVTPTVSPTTYYLETFTNFTGLSTAIPGCTSATRTPVVVRVNAFPTQVTAAGILTQNLTCDNNNNTVLVPSGSITAPNVARLYTSQTGGSPIATATTPTLSVNTPASFYILSINTPITATTVYYVAQANPITGCESETRTAVTVLLNAAPSAPSVTNVSRCGNGHVTFTVTSPTPGVAIVLYTLAAKPATGVTENSVVDEITPFELPTANMTGVNIASTATGTATALTQNTTYYVAARNGGCESARVPVVATINSIPAAPSLQDSARRCDAGAVTAMINPASVAGNSEVRLYTYASANQGVSRSQQGLPLGTPISVDNTAPYELVTGSIATNTFYHIATLNTLTGCESTRSAFIANISPVPSLPFTSDIFRCGTGTVTFSVTRGSNVAATDVFRLYTVASGGTPVTTLAATDASSATSYNVVTPVITTTTTFYLSVFNNLTTATAANNCEGPRKMVIATVNPGPDDPTLANISRCSTGTAVLSVFMGATPGTEVRLWNNATSTASTALLATVPTNLGANAQVLVETPTITTTTTFYVEVRNPGLFNCSSTNRVAVTVTVNENPSAPTVTNTAIQACGPGNVQISSTLTAPVNELRVYTQASGGTFVSNDVRVTGPWVVTAPVMMTTNLYVAARNTTTGCESSTRTLVSVVVSNQVRPSTPVVSTASTNLLCGTGSAVISAAMGPIAGTSIRLYTVAASGSAISESTASPYQFTVSPTQRTTYYLAAHNSVSGCESDRVEYVVNTGSNLTAPQLSTLSLSRCGTGVVTFSANVSTVGTGGDQIRVYTMTTGGNPVSTISATQVSGTTQFLIATPSTSTTTTYYIASYESTTGCESGTRTALTVTINTTPDAPTVANVGRCSFGPVVFTVTMGTLAGTEARLYTVASGSTPIVVDVSSPYELSTTTLGNGSFNYFVSAFNALGCESPRVAVRAVVTQGVNMPTLSSSTTAGCGAGSSTMQFALGSQTANLISGTGIRLYTVQTGGTAVLTDDMAPYTVVSPIVNTTTTFWAAAYDLLTGCESSRIQAIVNVVSAVPTAPMVSDITQCIAGAGTFVFTVMPGTIHSDEVRLYTQATGGLPVSTTTDAPYTFNVNSVSTTSTYYFAIGAGAACESPRTAARAIVNALPSSPSVSGAQRCSGGVVSFNANMGAIPGARIVLYDAPVGGNIIDQDNTFPYTLRATINATTNFWASAETDQCVSSRVQVTGSVSQPPLVHTFSSNNIAVCPGSRGTFIGNLNGYGNELRMYNAPAGGNLIAIANPIISNTTPFPLETPVLNNTTQFFVSAFDNVTGCETSRIPVTATVGNPSAPQLANITVSRCGPGPVMFTASLPQPSGTSLRLYSQAAGGSVIDSDMDGGPEYMVTTPNLSSPRTMFYIAVGAGTCESDRVAVMANILSGPSLPTASDVARCGVGQVTFTINMGAIAGTYVRLYDAEMGGNLIDQDNAFEYLLSTSFITTNTDFYVAVGNQTCETNRIKVRALVGAQPGAPAPVASQVSICGRGSVMFALNQNLTAPGTAIRLYTESIGGVPIAIDTQFPFELSTPIINATQSFFAAAVLGNCESDRVQLTAVSTAAPSAPIINNVTRCGVGPVVFSVSQGTIAGNEVRLYATATDPLAIAVDNTAPYELATPPLTTSATFFASAVTGSCESIRVPVTAVVGATLTAPSVSGVTICGSGVPVFTVINNPGGGSELRLYANPMGGAPIATTDRAPFTLTGTAIATTTTFYAASGTGTCESARVPVIASILLGTTPSAPSAAAVTRCGAGSVVVTAFMGSNPGQTIRLWSAPAGGQLVAEAAQGPTYLLNVAQVNGSVTYYASATTGQCESARTPVAITIVTTAPTPVVSNVAICGGQSSSTVFTANFGTATNVEARLYTVPFGGAPIAIDPAAPYELSTPVLQFTSNFYVAGAVGSCEGQRVLVTASITQVPSAPMASDVTICNTNTAVISASFGNTPGTQIRLYTQAAGGVAIAAASAAPYNLTVSNVATQTTYYIASALAGNCESGRTPVVVSLGRGPAVAANVTNETCTALGSILVSVSPAGNYSYLLNTNVVGTPIGNGTEFTNLSAGTYTITVSTAGGCQTQTTATINQPAAPTSLTSSNINATTATLTWAPVLNAISYTLEYRVAGSTAPYMSMNVLGTITSQTLSGLQVGTTYEARVNTTCSNRRVSSYAGTTFTTLAQSGAGNCSTPTNVTAVATGASRARISWTPNISGAVCYIVSYGPADNPENTWNQFLVQHPTSSIEVDVQPGVRYATRVRTNCTTCGLRTGTITPASAIANFGVNPKLAEVVSTPDMGVSVYPNPNNGTFQIGFNAIEEGAVNVNVVDLNGRTVATHSFEAVEGQNEFTVALDNVASGIYFVNFRQGVNVAKMKIRVN